MRSFIVLIHFIIFAFASVESYGQLSSVQRSECNDRIKAYTELAERYTDLSDKLFYRADTVVAFAGRFTKWSRTLMEQGGHLSLSAQKFAQLVNESIRLGECMPEPAKVPIEHAEAFAEWADGFTKLAEIFAEWGRLPAAWVEGAYIGREMTIYNDRAKAYTEFAEGFIELARLSPEWMERQGGREN
ncbi:MAG: hypothetical protein OXH01_02245 [Bacteroidetes bacterium]|nr:hypothetical protein [Bacteroidota bacterium]